MAIEAMFNKVHCTVLYTPPGQIYYKIKEVFQKVLKSYFLVCPVSSIKGEK